MNVCVYMYATACRNFFLTEKNLTFLRNAAAKERKVKIICISPLSKAEEKETLEKR